MGNYELTAASMSRVCNRQFPRPQPEREFLVHAQHTSHIYGHVGSISAASGKQHVL